MKTCTGCNETKPLDQFARKKRANKTGYASRCKECHNKYYREYWQNSEAYEKHKARSRSNRPKKRAAKYGLTVEQVDKMFKDNPMCQICGEKPANSIDHSHVDNTVRGVLCSTCNSGLGKLGDSIEGLERAMKYLRTRGQV